MNLKINIKTGITAVLEISRTVGGREESTSYACYEGIASVLRSLYKNDLLNHLTIDGAKIDTNKTYPYLCKRMNGNVEVGSTQRHDKCSTAVLCATANSSELPNLLTLPDNAKRASCKATGGGAFVGSIWYAPDADNAYYNPDTFEVVDALGEVGGVYHS